ncbi:uncharacterized protein LOC119636069 isoform X1 [Glossina fuscipes]|uniref:Uncharacterized protein LOC119636069 isoform X1 n=1 Tax=Glossina fuscipes TaxID=7396 RepID=A0A9C6DSU0_9MUSC|nr:uncharacterized protein LOC119636069 isoform X1 [Glossina fuscipes]XP_037887088.1 uncharacterized protein LOC119636069 isoform X1 [Glossina fuscipes]XP_037887089.1 uncharacterized protein LOC119636069 isoform X1 [Glossina fuscipes]KAI9583739.1 hypothetical protein GQX74_005487 [Glossina fuscipes]
MDRSMDSIGSCSLDVDAESTDISDTSGSLNFPTPISIKDITREFTNNIRERCSVQTVKNTTAYVDPTTGQVCIALTQPPTITNNNIDNSELTYKTIVTPQTPDNGSYEKKPSYLNLACCVNGYSNITTYDSKIRQDINKSREVSPIRPSSSSLQYCKKNNCLAPPILLTMPNVNPKSPQSHLTSPKSNSNNSGIKYIRGDNNNHTENGESQKECPKLSFIQQRVERLYGPGALAPGFYSPKKKESASINGSESTEGLAITTTATTELARKFQELSPSKDYNQFRKKFEFSGRSANLPTNPTPIGNENNQLEGNNNVDLPCLRHLSQEFRAQLPTISPKRNYLQRISTSVVEQEYNRQNLNGDDDAATQKQQHDVKLLINVQNRKSSNERDEVDHERCVQIESQFHSPETKNVITKAENKMQKATTNGFSETGKDGHYFLQQLKMEQARLLNMASEAEKCMETLKHNSEVSEDVMGFLRSASGKARLLVSQKMKQFEGLCHKNLKNSSDDKFPTTLDDLQGFWDMVYLQIDHVDSLFNEIEELKQNGWKKPKELKTSVNRTPRTVKTPLSKNRNSSTNSINSTPSVAAVKREVQRKKLQEIKRRNREAMAGSNTVTGEDSDVTIDVVVQTPKKLDGKRIRPELS